MKNYSINTISEENIRSLESDLLQATNSEESMEAAAQRLARTCFERFVQEDGASEFVLARVYRTISFSSLPPEMQKVVLEQETNPQERKFLCLLGTHGIEEQWCRRGMSENYQVQAVPQQASESPMFSALFEELGIDPISLEANSGRSNSYFHVPEAKGAAAIPAQEGFVDKYGIRSVVGFGGSLPGGDMYAVLGFTRVSVLQAQAQKISQLSQASHTLLSTQIEAPIFAELS